MMRIAPVMMHVLRCRRMVEGSILSITLAGIAGADEEGIGVHERV